VEHLNLGFVFSVRTGDYNEVRASLLDEGMTNRPSIFAYLVFVPEEVTVEGVARPIRTAAGRGPGATLGVQARIRRVQD
jgi:hypothetical protein